MTTVQSDTTNTLLNRLLLVLVVLFIVCAISTVLLYNRYVNLSHGITEMKDSIRSLQTGNSEIKDKIFAMTSSENLAKFAVERGLVTDKQPQYLSAQTPWSLASR
jgi:cell division protein FtsL